MLEYIRNRPLLIFAIAYVVVSIVSQYILYQKNSNLDHRTTNIENKIVRIKGIEACKDNPKSEACRLQLKVIVKALDPDLAANIIKKAENRLSPQDLNILKQAQDNNNSSSAPAPSPDSPSAGGSVSPSDGHPSPSPTPTPPKPPTPPNPPTNSGSSGNTSSPQPSGVVGSGINAVPIVGQGVGNQVCQIQTKLGVVIVPCS